MSFELVCDNCGAISGPSVGMCPYCKNVLVSSAGEIKGQQTVSEHYNSGRLDLALGLAQKVYKENAEAKDNVKFLLLYVKILIETEGPNSLINTLLADGMLKDPKNQELIDYSEIINARGNLKKGKNDLGEQALKNVLKRSPDNIHALFLLGSHIFWVDEDPMSAVFYLERCLQLAPKFLRGWGCAAVVYKALGNNQLAYYAFGKCIELETNAAMKQVFIAEQKKIS